MSHNDLEWLGELVATDLALVETAPGGALSTMARRAAVESSLSLLGLYFAQGNHDLVNSPAASRSPDAEGLDELLAGLRLRVAIAAGQRLFTLTEAIMRRPTFRYQLQSSQEIGSLSNALDVNKWVTEPRGNQDISYPVLSVERALQTPENILLVFAARWLLKELMDSFNSSLATTDAVEYQVVRRLRERLSRLVRVPALAGCIQASSGIRTVSSAKHLISQVQRRLQRREVTHAQPYAELTSWIDECIRGKPAVSPGDLDLAVYGDRFDSKLFELWCLNALGRALASSLNLPPPSAHAAWRDRMPAYRFDTFAGSIELHFQRGVRSISEANSPVWRRDDGRPLGGVPDIVVKASPRGDDTRLAIVDPKLRQRDRLPAEELYKILGYLQNYAIKPGAGIVIIYTTGINLASPAVFHDGQGGILISIALNPSAPESVTNEALYCVVRVILQLVDYRIPTEPISINSADAGGKGYEEQLITQVQESILAWGRTHLGDIASSRERLETLIGSERWKFLDEDVQIMMATADLVGHSLDRVADFSGPAIGMCASVEHILHSSVLSPVVGNDVSRQAQTRTLGAGIDAIEVACRSQGNQLHRDIRTYMIDHGISPDNVLELTESWRQLNRNFRIPAAHRQVLTKSSWQQLYRLLFGPESLFTETFDVLIHSNEDT